MFCYQCEQTAKGTGCTVRGVCGKDENVAAGQDLLTHLIKGISMNAHRARKYGASAQDVDSFVVKTLFTTVTNVNFDPDRLASLLREGLEVRQKARAMYEEACRGAGDTVESASGPAVWKPVDDPEKLLEQGEEIGIPVRREKLGEDVAGVQELIYYGLKGAAAYLYHAEVLGKTSDEIYAKLHEILDFLAVEPTDLNDLLGKALETGDLNLRAMALLDEANTETYGHPEPTVVRITAKEGKAILVSGHDLKDLEELLKQTEGKDINVYTHGEMLPTLAYPVLKKYAPP